MHAVSPKENDGYGAARRRKIHERAVGGVDFALVVVVCGGDGGGTCKKTEGGEQNEENKCGTRARLCVYVHVCVPECVCRG